MRPHPALLVVALAACVPTEAPRDAAALDAARSIDAPDARDANDAFVSIDAACPLPDTGAVPPLVRLVAPLSSARTTSVRPTFHWRTEMPVPATLEVCADRACTSVIASVDTMADHAAPPSDLPAGLADWRVTVTPAGSTSVTSATWSVRIPHRGAPTDTSWGSVLDLDGNGFVDLAVPGNAGLYVYMNDGGMFPDYPTTRLPDAGPVDAGDVNGDGYADLIAGTLHLGSELGLTDTGAPAGGVGAGDIDGDGYADVVATGRDWIDVVFGGPTALGCGSRSQTLPRPIPSNYFRNVLPVGDLDADGFADVAVIPELSDMGDYGVTIYYGSTVGLVRATPLDLPAPSIRFASSLSGLGDLNGDGYGDLAVSAPEGGGGRPYGSGTVYLYYGGLFGVPRTPSQQLVAPAAMGTPFGFGQAMGIVGDLDADGFDDLAVEVDVPGTSGTEGAVYVFPGGVSGLGTAIVIRRGARALASAFGSARDMDGDAIDDLVVGSTWERPVGAILFFRGSTGGVATTPSVLLTCPDSGSYGTSFAMIRARSMHRAADARSVTDHRSRDIRRCSTRRSVAR